MRRAWLVILLAAPAGAEDDLDALVKDLGSAQYAVRDHAYRTLAQRKDARVIPKIENGLPSWKPENQYRALLVIGAFPPKQSHPVLRRLLKSKDPHLRMCGATQLHQRGEKGMEPVIAGILRGPVPEEMLDPVVARVRYLRLGSVHEAWAALITPKRKELTLYVWLASLSSEGFEGAQPQAKRIVDEDPRSGPRAVACAYLIRCHDSSYAATLARIIVEQPLDTSAASRVRYLLRDGRNYPATVCEAILKRLPEEKNESVAVAYIGILA
ncbi:MAG: HEAT repeat domain-containing protein, partial [Planctomycetota bacterium]